jgi:hypothetical protein
MRIAYVCQAYRPMVNGPAVVVQHLAEGMCRRGHGVLVLTASDTGRTYVKPDSNLRLSGLTSVPNPFRVGQRIMLLPRNAVLRELDAFRPQLIHPHEPLGIGLASIRLARSAGIPVILTVQALPLSGSPAGGGGGDVELCALGRGPVRYADCPDASYQPAAA